MSRKKLIEKIAARMALAAVGETETDPDMYWRLYHHKESQPWWRERAEEVLKLIEAEMAPQEPERGWRIQYLSDPYRNDQLSASVRVESYEDGLDKCLDLHNSGTLPERLVRPDGVVELEGRYLREAMWAYGTRKGKTV